MIFQGIVLALFYCFIFILPIISVIFCFIGLKNRISKKINKKYYCFFFDFILVIYSFFSDLYRFFTHIFKIRFFNALF